MQILWKDLNVQKQIGEGSFGKVYLAKWRETTVAAKVLLGGTTNSTDEEFPNRDSPLLDGLTKVSPGLSLSGWLRHKLLSGWQIAASCHVWLWTFSMIACTSPHRMPAAALA